MTFFVQVLFLKLWNGRTPVDKLRKRYIQLIGPMVPGHSQFIRKVEKNVGMEMGVVPIKKPCLERLRKLGWRTEKLPPLQHGVIKPGDLDALFQCDRGFIGFEWETGNISSSHRAINKLVLTMQIGGLIGGFLVVPSDELKPYLTDRIGNIGELRPYLPLWNSIPIKEGILRIIVVEHDATSYDVPRIPKGTDGRALQ